MKRIILVVITVLIIQLIYFSYQISLIKQKVSNNAIISNDRSNAQLKLSIDQQEQINDLREAIKLIANHIR
jgi:hypothetical protein